MNKRILLSTILLFIFGISIAQPLNRANASSMREISEIAIEQEDYYNALIWLKKLYEEDKEIDVANNLAFCYSKLRDYKKAANYYKRVIKKDKEGEYIDAIFQEAKMKKMLGLYEEASAGFQMYADTTSNDSLKEITQIEILGCEFAMEQTENLGLTIDHAGKPINTKMSEYGPTYLRDNKTIYFSTFNENKVIELEKTGEGKTMKVFKSTKGDKEWSKMEELNIKVNREGYHSGNPTISPDGSIMYFTRALLENGKLAESNIYMSSFDGTEFGASEKLLGINGDWIATQPAYGEHFGNEVLFFVSNMPGGEGGWDIYYATKKGMGVYGDPINLGPNINTPGDEMTPFYKNGTLYFSSDYLSGLGGFDVFQSEWNGVTWSKPENLGLGYNSSVNDLYFELSPDGYSGFIVSNRDGNSSVQSKTCCNDLFEFSIAKIEASLLAGVVTNGKTKLTNSNISVIEMVNNKEGKFDKKNTGESFKAAFVLDLEKTYMVIAQKEGYYPDTIEITTVGLEDSKQLKHVFDLKPIPKPKEPDFETYSINQPIELKNIFYDFDDDKILPASEADLGIILDLMEKYPDMKIDLYSHTDSQGKDSYNQKLSQRRASSAKRWLTSKGISASRIRAIGKGEKEIRNQCTNGVKCSDEEHRYNRRTEFKITAGPTTFTIEKKRLRKQ